MLSSLRALLYARRPVLEFTVLSVCCDLQLNCPSRGLGTRLTLARAPGTRLRSALSAPPKKILKTGPPNKAPHLAWERGRSPLGAPRHLRQTRSTQRRTYHVFESAHHHRI